MITSMFRVSCWALVVSISLLACKNKASKNPDGGKKTATTTASLDSAALINDLAYLSSGALEGRETGKPGNALARKYISHLFDSLELKLPPNGRLQPFSVGKAKDTATGQNVIGIITGSTYPDQYYVISAHYDHLGKKGDNLFFGADDNASGSACLLALARYFRQHQPKHSLILASFDAEEKGLVGSRYFVKNMPVESAQVLLNVNMDMISRNDKNEIYASGTYHNPFLKKYIDSIRLTTPLTVSFGHDTPNSGHDDWTSQSDHLPFHQAKIPYLYFGVEDHPDYHKPTDSFEKVNKEFYYRVCEMIKSTIVLLDSQGKLQ
ncbi:M28 family peptidase [Paraflavitalea pollutisoli]|uniref:M28 family peptidase n=1 Tax=Paraflavitalea pollutisoli TaxID=3034143 RepID=UPI0023ED33EB|nr:M28 family peptidase [Paraflavitalea sp. H1-2-19X]